jgi:hypothetical protein
MKKGMRRFWLWGLAVQGSLVITLSCLAYAGGLNASILAQPHMDKVGHFFFIGLVGFFLDGLLEHRPLFRGHASFVRLGPVVVLALAGVDEFVQRYARHRDSSWLDFAADVAGIVFFSWLAKRLTNALETRGRLLTA